MSSRLERDKISSGPRLEDFKLVRSIARKQKIPKSPRGASRTLSRRSSNRSRPEPADALGTNAYGPIEQLCRRRLHKSQLEPAWTSEAQAPRTRQPQQPHGQRVCPDNPPLAERNAPLPLGEIGPNMSTGAVRAPQNIETANPSDRSPMWRRGRRCGLFCF